MERRRFFALLASAPLTALAPLPHFLPMRLIDPRLGISLRYIKQFDMMPRLEYRVGAIIPPHLTARISAD